ncbi:MAG TPA: hypothetical protein VF765_34800 [Polyangiaceae bacterium]
MGNRGKAAVALAFAAMLVACDDHGSSSGTATLASAVAASAEPAAESPPDPWSRYERPDSGAPGEAWPLSPYRADLLAQGLHEFEEVAKYPPPPPWIVKHPHYRVVADTFVVVQGDEGAPVDEVADLMGREVEYLWHGHRYLHRVDSAQLFWVFAKRANFERYREGAKPAGSLPTDISFYDPDHHIAYICIEGSSSGSAGHELGHVLTGADSPKASWALQEGFSEAWEVVTWDAQGKPSFAPHFRVQALRKALTMPGFAGKVSLEYLFSLSSADDFNKAGNLPRDLARELVRFLAAKYDLWAFWRAVRDHVLDDPDGSEALASVTGKTPAELTPDFIAWVRSPDAGPLP